MNAVFLHKWPHFRSRYFSFSTKYPNCHRINIVEIIFCPPCGHPHTPWFGAHPSSKSVWACQGYLDRSQSLFYFGRKSHLDLVCCAEVGDGDCNECLLVATRRAVTMLMMVMMVMMLVMGSRVGGWTSPDGWWLQITCYAPRVATLQLISHVRLRAGAPFRILSCHRQSCTGTQATTTNWLQRQEKTIWDGGSSAT